MKMLLLTWKIEKKNKNYSDNRRGIAVEKIYVPMQFLLMNYPIH